MAIQRLNHAVLYIRELERSVDFYTTVLGFRAVFRIPDGAFLQAEGSTNDHDLGLLQIDADRARRVASWPAPAGQRTAGHRSGDRAIRR